MLALLVVSCTALAACSDTGAKDVGAVPAVTTTAVTEPVTTTAPATTAVTAPVTTEAPVAAWEKVSAPADCMCSDGSEFSYFVYRGDPAKVVFFLQGGGACFSAATCGTASSSSKKTIMPDDDPSDGSGIFDLADARNPFAGWSMVFVPYCTGDVHIGNTTHDYGDGVVIEHKGAVNGTTALEAMAELFPDAVELVVTGESAGSVPTPMYAGLAHDLLPAARITVLADGSGAYPDVPVLNAVIGGAWGTENAIPDWPENEGLTAEQWSLPGLFVQAGKHAPDIVFARHDYAFDKTQVFFAGLAGIAADDLVSLIDKNEQQIEASGVSLFSYISPGAAHTVLSKPGFYTETLNGVLLVDWVSDLIAGTPVSDVHCDECKVAA